VTVEGRVQETKLAWELAEGVKPHLSAVERDDVFVSIGAGQTFAAIRHLFNLVAIERIPLRGDLVQQFTTWLHAYAWSRRRAVPSSMSRIPTQTPPRYTPLS